MKQADDHLALGVIEQSAIVTAVERVATRLGQAARASRVLRLARSIAGAVERDRGVTILSAVATHLVLVGVVARPVSWYWLIVPALFAAAGVVLAALPRPGGRRGE